MSYRIKGRLCTAVQYNAYKLKMENLEKGRLPTTTSPKKPQPAAKRRSLSPSPQASDDGFSPKRIELEMQNDLPVNNEKFCARGRRIVELAELAKNLWCCSCKECLSLQYAESETRRGLGSILSVRCHKCAVINIVPTGKLHAGPGGRTTLFDMNAKAAMGLLSAGCNWTHMTRFFANLNMPNMTFATFKKYERQMGPELEKVAKKSCEEAAKQERDFTIQNKTSMEQNL